MFKTIFTRLTLLTVGMMFVFSPAGQVAADENNIKDLRKSFYANKEKLLYGYLEKLVKLETKILTGTNPKEAGEIKAEIRKIEGEIERIPKDIPISSPVPRTVSSPQPASKPVVKRRIPKTHVSEIEGLAGAEGFSKNNVYTFQLPDTGKTSTLKFWATGRRSIDSVGYVWLITPDGRREKITKWKERYFDEPATEVSSYKRIEPFLEDITEYITKAGTYKVEFEWIGGIDPLVIYRVELTS